MPREEREPETTPLDHERRGDDAAANAADVVPASSALAARRQSPIGENGGGDDGEASETTGGETPTKTTPASHAASSRGWSTGTGSSASVATTPRDDESSSSRLDSSSNFSPMANGGGSDGEMPNDAPKTTPAVPMSDLASNAAAIIVSPLSPPAATSSTHGTPAEQQPQQQAQHIQQSRQPRPSPIPARATHTTKRSRKRCRKQSYLVRRALIIVVICTAGCRLLFLQLRLAKGDGDGRNAMTSRVDLLALDVPSIDAAKANAANMTSAIATTTSIELEDLEPNPCKADDDSDGGINTTRIRRRVIQPCRRVYVLPQPNDLPAKWKAGEYKHFVKDALRGSKHLHETLNPDHTDAAWVVEVIRCKCQELVPLVNASLGRRLERLRLDQRRRQQGNETNDGEKELTLKDVPGWDIYLLDYNDKGYARATVCAQELTQLLGSPKFVHFATRFHTMNRIVNPTRTAAEEFGQLGELINWTAHPINGWVNGVPRVLRYGVRGDMVDLIELMIEAEFNGTLSKTEEEDGLNKDDDEVSAGKGVAKSRGKGKDKPYIDVVTLPRPVDVANFWRIGADPREGNHRSGVALALSRMQENDRSHGINMRLGQIGSRAGIGRNNAQSDYVRALLETKIVVVCQRDRWEDQYRLMEALAAGAMAMTDPMSYLPLYLEDGKSVVVYRSTAELEGKIRYYLNHAEERLAVAREGRRIAMEHHRSWHGLERIVFGNWSSPMGVR